MKFLLLLLIPFFGYSQTTNLLISEYGEGSGGNKKYIEIYNGTGSSIDLANYQQTYDIYATPKVFVLDKDKKIIAKSLTISQLEDMLDKMQGKASLPKIFPPDEDDKENEQMH